MRSRSIALLTLAALSFLAVAACSDAGGKASLGTRKDPHPIGKGAEIGDWTVVVIGVTPDADDVIAAAYEFNEPPADGRQYVLIRLKATYHGDDPGTFWNDTISTFYGDPGNTYESATVVVPDEMADAREAQPGAVIEGNIVFEVPSREVEEGMLAVEETISFDDVRTFFKLQ